MNERDFTVSSAGTSIVFDFARQAWFPDDGQPLDANRRARATLKAKLKWETAIGIRSDDACFEIIERHQ